MGDCFAPRLAVLRHRNRIRVSALSGAIAIALSGCNNYAVAGYECVEAHPGWHTAEHFSVVLSGNPMPTGCRYVTDTEGWQRKMCESGPDQYTCRKATVTAATKAEAQQ